MPKPVSQQVVVVIGASSGIGRSTAVAFARAGARVVCAARSAEDLDTLVQEITSVGGNAVAVPTDVTDQEAVRALAARAQEHFGGIDTWVNAAAVGIWGRVEEVSAEEFDRVMRVNFLGHVHGIHAVLPVLRRGGGGVIIGVSSVEGIRSVPLHAAYTASKWALRALYDSLRVELAQEGVPIAVSTILPASIDTPFFEHARSKLDALPKPPAPVYAPELVADAVVRASEHPRREIPVGGAAAAFMIGQRLSPALTDAILSLPRVGAGSQTSGHADNGQDNLEAPMSGTGRAHGAHSGRVLTRSPFTEVVSRLPRPGEWATAAVARVQRMRSGSADAEGTPENESQQERKGTTMTTDAPTSTDGPADAMGDTPSGTGTPSPSPAGDADARGRGARRQDGSEVLDVDALENKLSGWGGNEAPDLSPQQATGLQEREEPVAAANFGELLTGDLGRAAAPSESLEGPETTRSGGRDEQDQRQ